MDNLSNFSERLCELLFDNNIKPRQFAEAVNVSLATVYHWKNNKKQILLKNLIAAADFFHCSIDFLVGRSEDGLPFSLKKCPPFSRRLREVMKEKGISTYYLRKTTRYDGKYFENWDKGSDPYLSTLIELADILDCTIDYLVGRDG